MRISLIMILLVSLSFSISAQSWSFIKESDIILQQDAEREIIPNEYLTVSLDFEAFKTQLESAPKESQGYGALVIEFPMPDGSFEKYAVVKSPVMAPELNAKYPDIKSYKAISVDNPANNARFDINAKGAHLGFSTPAGPIYIDPYAKHMKETYITYHTRNHVVNDGSQHFVCGNKETPIDFNVDPALSDELYNSLKDPMDPVEMRKYRLAWSATGEWGQFAGSVAEGIAYMNTVINRLNIIFENEIALRMELVADNDLLIFMDASTDPFAMTTGEGSGGSLISINTSVVNGLIGNDAYDIGHIYNRPCDVGGVANLGSMCDQVRKAAGCTCLWPNGPSIYSVNVTAHEMGHQMTANHTMSSCMPDSQVGGGAVEPGSGSTIMSYHGLCGGNNLNGNEFSTYHVGSMIEIFNHTRNGGNGDCGEKLETNNTTPNPTVPYADGFYIPIMTPFELTGEAEDAEGDNMTYNWEQFDFAPGIPLGTAAGVGALFRTLLPSENKTRIFPQITTVISGFQDEAELMPSVSRELNFRFVVRDNNPEGGGVEWDGIKFLVTADAGPFEVLYPNDLEIFNVGDEIDVTWDVANTDGDLVNCQKVSIYLSLQAGLEKDYLLASNQDNDGSATVVIPNRLTTLGRMYVVADDNIFFDISDTEFFIREATDPGILMDVFPKFSAVCLPDAIDYTLTAESLLGYSEPVHYEVLSGLPPNATATFDQNDVLPDTEVKLNIDLANVTQSGSYPIIVRATSGMITQDREITIETTGGDLSSLAMLTPAPNADGFAVAPVFTWVDVPDAHTYSFQLATSPAFGAGDLLIDDDNLFNPTLTTNLFLPQNSQYYWRVSAQSPCSAGDWLETRMFGTETLSCAEGVAGNLPILMSGFGVVQGQIPVNSSGTVKEVNIKKIKGLHTRVSDLVVKLVSPMGTEVALFSEICGNSSNYNVGFNDKAPLDIDCPLSNGVIYKPEGSFADLVGEESNGIWKIIIDDVDAGNDGSFDEATIEICTNSSLAPPMIVNNNVLQLPPESGQLFLDTNLLAEDSDNTPAELEFVLVTVPTEGILELNGSALLRGGNFTQQDIDNGNLNYRHNLGNTAATDGFKFSVNDGAGGWVGITDFNIEIDAAFTSDVKDLKDLEGVRIYPNPASKEITLELNNPTISNYQISLINLNGQQIMSLKDQRQRLNLDIQDLPTGTYVLELISGANKYQTKVIKVQ